MLTNNIIVHDSFFNLTNKSNLIQALIRFFDHLVVAYFFGPPCTCMPNAWNYTWNR